MSLVVQTPAWLKSNAIARAIPVADDPDPKLAFMLAQQSITRWRLDADRLGDAVDMGSDEDTIATEAETAANAMAALKARIEPFTCFVDLATRFEAQEILAALDDLASAFARILRRTQPAPWRDPERLAAELQARRQQEHVQQ